MSHSEVLTLLLLFAVPNWTSPDHPLLLSNYFTSYDDTLPYDREDTYAGVDSYGVPLDDAIVESYGAPVQEIDTYGVPKDEVILTTTPPAIIAPLPIPQQSGPIIPRSLIMLGIAILVMALWPVTIFVQSTNPVTPTPTG